MSRPLRMQCEECQRDITIAGARICMICTPIRKGFEIEDLDAADKGPALCSTCFDKIHGNHEIQVGGGRASGA